MKNPFSLNPVALRELRQLVRSRVITWSFALYPAILFGFTMLAVATAMGKRSAEDIAFGSGIGEGPFTMVAVITGIVACLGIPFYAAMKAILDTNRNGPGLEFTTALTPANIVGGRLVSTAILIASAVATAMPFFIFAYLLRGITLEQVFLTPLALFGYAIAMFSLSLVIACRPVAVPLRVIMTVGLFFAIRAGHCNRGVCLPQAFRRRRTRRGAVVHRIHPGLCRHSRRAGPFRARVLRLPARAEVR